MADIVPTSSLVDVRYGPDAHQRYDVAKHSVTDPTGNPCILWRHGGGWNTNDKRQPFFRSQRGNNLFEVLLNNHRGPNDMHFTCISYETRQAAWGSPLQSKVYIPASGSVTGASWAHTTGVLTFTDGFANYTFRTGDVFVATGGVGVTTGTYPVLNKVGSNAITLDADTIAAGDLGAVVQGYVLSSLGASVTGWYDEQTTCPCYFPDTFEDTKRAILHVKQNAATLGIDPNKIVIGGSSAGAVMAMWSQFTEPMVQPAQKADTRQTRYLGTGGVDSRCCGTLLHILPTDFRKAADGTTESVTYSAWNNLFGVSGSSATEAGLIPASARAAVSLQHYVENKLMRWAPQLNYLTYETFSGSDTKPFTTGHEGIQFDILMAAARRAGVDQFFGGNKAVGTTNIPPGEECYQAMVRMCQTPTGSIARPYPVGASR